MLDLPVEIVHYTAYEVGRLSAADVVALALTCKDMYARLLGPLGAEDAFDRAQHQALLGVLPCCKRGWWMGAVLATTRGYGDVNEGYRAEGEEGKGSLWTPLTMACAAGQVALLKALVRRGVDPTWKRHLPLRLACANGWDACVAFLLEDGRVDPAIGRNSLVREAAAKGRAGIVALLAADQRVDPGAKANEAIRFAAMNGYADVVEVLLSHAGVDPGAGDNAALRFASWSGHLDVVRVLVRDPRVDVGARGGAAVADARKNGFVGVVSVLCAATASTSQ